MNCCSGGIEPVEVVEVLNAYSILSWMQGMKFLWPQAIIEQLTKGEGTSLQEPESGMKP